ncbi:MAG: GNAT family N-acetyltransferase [Desulfobacterales bacterium]
MIEYKINFPITVDQFIDLLNKSTLCERRPMHDIECLKGMVENSNLTITAWHADTLIGIARSVTDFHFACYLSDLAVDKKYQRKGVGKKLQIITQNQLGPNCKLILIAAPAANEYYRKLGYTQNDRCWVFSENRKLST